jgi:GTP-binding protein Era
MIDTREEADHRSGFVALLGRPSVGKSSLLNAILRQNVAAVSPRPQTTRRRQRGILSLPGAQIIFLDTPGIHSPRHQLGEWMMREVQEVIEDADLLLGVFDISQMPTEDDARVGDLLSADPRPGRILGVLNKMDRAGREVVESRAPLFGALLPIAEWIPTSAVRGDNMDVLLQALLSMLPRGPRYYPDDLLTDRWERDLAEDLIRASAMHFLRDEVPYSLAVRLDEYREREDTGAYVAATLFVERDSQKGIVIGKGARTLREIGTFARKEIEALTGRRVYLDLHVKVLPGWRNDVKSLQQLGLGPAAR